MAEAENNQDAYAFFLALRDFAMAFKDGHVGLNGGDLEGAYNQSTVLGGYGFAVRELDDGNRGRGLHYAGRPGRTGRHAGGR